MKAGPALALLLWLCHVDARQVSDLPGSSPLDLAVYDRNSSGRRPG